MMYSQIEAALAQTRRCSSQSFFWCSGEQYFTNRHLLHTSPLLVGVSPLSALLCDPSLLSAYCDVSSLKQMLQSIQLHISRDFTFLPFRRPRFIGNTAAPSMPRRGKRIISQSSLQHGLGQPLGKSKNISSDGTNSGCVNKIWE